VVEEGIMIPRYDPKPSAFCSSSAREPRNRFSM
jgi:hypothetical protein